MNSLKSVAIIGSFKQYYEYVREVWRIFNAVGITVTTPKGSYILENGIPFVRFQSDNSEWSDETVQVVALHRILRADFVYVVAPNGYVGRTTCYEVGRIIQARRPIYFSQTPKDLPILIPSSHLMKAEVIADKIKSGEFKLEPLYASIPGMVGDLERKLVDGLYSNL